MIWNQTRSELKGWVRDSQDIFADNKQQTVFIVQEGDKTQPFFPNWSFLYRSQMSGGKKGAKLIRACQEGETTSEPDLGKGKQNVKGEPQSQSSTGMEFGVSHGIIKPR